MSARFRAHGEAVTAAISWLNAPEAEAAPPVQVLVAGRLLADECDRLRRDLDHAESQVVALADVIRALRRALPPDLAGLLERELDDRGIEVGQ